jgi:hypothetical protein
MNSSVKILLEAQQSAEASNPQARRDAIGSLHQIFTSPFVPVELSTEARLSIERMANDSSPVVSSEAKRALALGRGGGFTIGDSAVSLDATWDVARYQVLRSPPFWLSLVIVAAFSSASSLGVDRIARWLLGSSAGPALWGAPISLVLVGLGWTCLYGIAAADEVLLDPLATPGRAVLRAPIQPYVEWIDFYELLSAWPFNFALTVGSSAVGAALTFNWVGGPHAVYYYVILVVLTTIELVVYRDTV